MKYVGTIIVYITISVALLSNSNSLILISWKMSLFDIDLYFDFIILELKSLWNYRLNSGKNI